MQIIRGTVPSIRGVGHAFIVATLLAAIVGLVVPGSAPAAPVPKQKRPTVEDVRKRLFATCWYETGKVVAGKNDPIEPLGWKFGADEAENWQITGELTTDRMLGGVKIDVSGDVWRMDLFRKDDRGRVSVLPTVFKFEGDTLVWATEFPGEGWYQEVALDGNYKGRPTGFKSTKENRYVVYRLKACDYLQTTPPK